jgi:mono/diheme cytochrome c family protein
MRTILKNFAQLLLSIIILCSFLSLAFAQETKTKEEKKLDPKTIFADKKCSSCHSIESAGIVKKSGGMKTGPPDLSTIGSKHDAAWMAKFVQKNESLNGKKHMIKFAGSDEELKALTQWLGTLKEAESKKK